MFKPTTGLKSLPASGEFCRLLLIFANPFYHRSDPTERPGSKLLDTLTLFLKDVFEKVNFGKSQQVTKTCKDDAELVGQNSDRLFHNMYTAFVLLQQQNLGRRFGTSKMHLSPPVA